MNESSAAIPALVRPGASGRSRGRAQGAGRYELLRDVLQQDYQAMLDAQIFFGETLAFDHIVERLAVLEREINRKE